MSSWTRSALIEIAAADPSPAAVITCARGFAAFPAAQTPGDARASGGVDADEAEIVGLAAELLQESVEARAHLGPDEESGSLNGSTVAEHHTPQAVVLDDDPANLAFDNADVAGFELLALRLGEVVCVREEDQVV